MFILMSYVKHILLPSEQVLYDGHVHPTVLVPGAIMLGLSAAILTQTGDTGGVYSVILAFWRYLAHHFFFAAHIYAKLMQWQNASPTIDFDIKVFAVGLALYGFSKVAKGFVLMETTELMITDQRVIAKIGVMNVITVEMDRNRIAGVTVYQSMPGRIMGYGYIMIQGFTSHISGLPPMVNPHLVERFIG